KPEDSRYLSPARLASELADEVTGRRAEIARDLNVLLGASELLHSLRGTEAIARQLLQSAFEVTPAQRGAVVLFDAEGTEENAAFGWEREVGGAAAPNYQALIDRVKEELATVSCDDSAAGGAALIGAPLVAFEKMLGVIALEPEGAAG